MLPHALDRSTRAHLEVQGGRQRSRSLTCRCLISARFHVKLQGSMSCHCVCHMNQCHGDLGVWAHPHIGHCSLSLFGKVLRPHTRLVCDLTTDTSSSLERGVPGGSACLCLGSGAMRGPAGPCTYGDLCEPQPLARERGRLRGIGLGEQIHSRGFRGVPRPCCVLSNRDGGLGNFLHAEPGTQNTRRFGAITFWLICPRLGFRVDLGSSWNSMNNPRTSGGGGRLLCKARLGLLGAA